MNQVEISGETHDLGDLSPNEKELIFYIRNRFQFGEIVVQTRNGKPYRIVRGVEYQTVGG